MLKQGLHVSLIKISAHVHPTEVIDKVKLALSSLLAIDPASLEENLEDSALEGDYTNKIHALTWTIKKPKDIESFLSRMKDGLPDEQKKVLGEYFSSFYNPDAKTFFVRLHKQSAFENMFNISQYDDIFHVSIKFHSYTAGSSAGNEANVLAFLTEMGIVS
ncbi:MAG TPA: RNA-binding domain-containing protein [Candidatus Lokiarchaeia archaeon]|nr:RNA-binding domain-containing protein [Candidatus Lokiarchaeia archaeon]